MFNDRQAAGRALATKLRSYRGTDAVVLALPRGGVVLGHEVAHALSLPLDIIAVRKIGHPFSPEYAIGVVDERGIRIMNEAEVASLDATWLKEEIERQQKEAQRRSSLYRAGKEPLGLKNKIAIIIDDGIATGLTMRLAVRVAREQGGQKVIVAVPVASMESIKEITAEGADEVIVLENPEQFEGAIGAHYAMFEQVNDEEVIRLLR